MSAVPFTLEGFRAGFFGIAPLAAGTAFYGMAFGVLASQTGLDALSAALMSGIVYAGAAQMVALQGWAEPVPLIAIWAATFAMNARYLLLGAALRPWFGALPVSQAYSSLFVMGDGNWALALREKAAGRDDGAYLLGSGVALYICWVGATLFGHLAGRLLADPRAFGLDFLLPAFCVTLIFGIWRKSGDALPLIVAAAAAIAIERLLPGPWYILLGGLAGSIVGAVRPHAQR